MKFDLLALNSTWMTPARKTWTFTTIPRTAWAGKPLWIHRAFTWLQYRLKVRCSMYDCIIASMAKQRKAIHSIDMVDGGWRPRTKSITNLWSRLWWLNTSGKLLLFRFPLVATAGALNAGDNTQFHHWLGLFVLSAALTTEQLDITMALRSLT